MVPTCSGSHIYPNLDGEEGPAISHWGVVGNTEKAGKQLYVERIREMGVQPAGLPVSQG